MKSATLAISLLIAALLGYGGLAPAPARAGTIVLNTSVRAQHLGQTLRVQVTLLNKGDEAAQRISTVVSLADQSREIHGPENLEPNRPHTFSLHLPFKPSLPGTYAVLLRVNFHDVNNYPFSSLAWGLFSVGKFGPVALRLRGKPGNTYPGRPPRFELLNITRDKMPLRLNIYAPNELFVTRPELDLELVGGRNHEVEVGVENRGGMVGATYPLLGVASYEFKGIHQTVVAQALTKVSPSRDPLEEWRPYLYALAGLLLAGMIGAWYLARRRKGLRA